MARKIGSLVNGIEIIKCKKWNTKNVYSSTGYLVMRYFRCPKNISFKSPLVNDENQHLCGGWHWYDDPMMEAVKRVLANLKPFCICYFPKDRKSEIDNIVMNLGDDFDYRITTNDSLQGFTFLLSWKGMLWEIFNLDDLSSIYAENGFLDITVEINKLACHSICDFYDNWDNRGWLTGLILGYPIENTISLLR